MVPIDSPVVFLARTSPQLTSFLNRTRGPLFSRKRYLRLKPVDGDWDRIFSEQNFKELVNDLPLVSKKDFIQAYIDLIGQMSQVHHSRLWWAMDLSSKNRFMNQLPHLLEQFLKAAKAIEQKNYDCLVITGIPWEIYGSLCALVGKQEGLGYQVEVFIRTCFAFFRRMITVMYHFLRITGRTLYTRLFFKGVDTKRTDSPVYAVKSFAYCHSFADDQQYKDVFFGPLDDFLSQRTQVIYWVNILGDFKQCIQKIRSLKAKNVVPLEAFLSISEMFGEFIKFLFFKISIRQELKFFNYDVRQIVINELRRSCYKIQPYQLLHYGATARFVKKFRPGTFLLTYENNPWEKMCIMALRECSPLTKIVGYQHTVVPQASLNMFISSRELNIIPLPDRIIATGEIPKLIIEEYGQLQGERIVAGLALRFEKLLKLPLAETKNGKTLLVALEGILEAYHMVNYVLKELKDERYWNVIFRFHPDPVLPFERIERHLIYDPRSVSHMEISKESSLIKDLERSDAVIYWGSTAALEALWIGRPIIHYNNRSFLSCDPLFQCPFLKWNVQENESLLKILNDIAGKPRDIFREQQLKAREYLGRYFHQITEKEMEKFIID